MTLHYHPNWKEKVVFSDDGPQPTVLFENPQTKVIVAGLAPGQKIPTHPEEQGVYHFLEGKGWMTVNDQRFAVSAGATVIAEKGDSRGIEAETNLTFFATKTVALTSESN